MSTCVLKDAEVRHVTVGVKLAKESDEQITIELEVYSVAYNEAEVLNGTALCYHSDGPVFFRHLDLAQEVVSPERLKSCARLLEAIFDLIAEPL